MSTLEHRWTYVRPGEYATCDDCRVTQRMASLREVLEHNEKVHRCRDEQRCARWQHERTKAVA